MKGTRRVAISDPSSIPGVEDCELNISTLEVVIATRSVSKIAATRPGGVLAKLEMMSSLVLLPVVVVIKCCKKGHSI